MQISVLPLGALQTNCYVVADEQAGSCAVIDPGDSGSQVAQALENLGLTLRYILLTHGHFDHVGGVRALHEAAGAPVYLHKNDLTLPASITAGPLTYTDTYAEGDVLAMDAVTFRVLETPGHTPGSVCLLASQDGAEPALFTGDTLFQASCGRTDFPGGSMEDMAMSLHRLSALDGDFRVYPGHGGETTLEQERRYNPYMREAGRP